MCKKIDKSTRNVRGTGPIPNVHTQKTNTDKVLAKITRTAKHY